MTRAAAPGTAPDGTEPATLVAHKPPGLDPMDPSAVAAWLQAQNRWPGDGSGWPLLERHFDRQVPVLPLETQASGLVAFSQDGRVRRRLSEDAVRLEQEFIVDVEGELAPYGWSRLTGGTHYQGWPVAPFKVSWQSERRLRFAIKGVREGLLQHLCAEVGLRATAFKRLRVGRIGLAKMPPGQWRYLPVAERF